MTLETDLFDALSPLCAPQPNGSLGCYPDVFPQKDQPYAWPAIRYIFVDGVPGLTVCGDGSDDETDFRVQIDGIAGSAVTRDALRLAVQAAMAAFPVPAHCESWGKDYDTDTKAYRVRLDYTLHPSTAT